MGAHMSKFSMIKTDNAAIINVGDVEITVTEFRGKIVAYVIDHANDTFTEVNGQYPALEDRGDMQSESMMLHGGA